MWIDHLALLPGDSSVTTSYSSVSSGVGSGLAALVVYSSTTGETTPGGGNKTVWTALEVPPRYSIVGVRVCYELTDAGSFISQVRLSQVQDPPGSAAILLDDPTDQTAVGPICVDIRATSIDPAKGPLLLDLRVNFGNTSDAIAIRGVGLWLLAKP
jgi:hypothetical protein